MKRVFPILLILLLTIHAVGCTQQKQDLRIPPVNSTVVTEQNPFQEEGETPYSALGSIGHCPTVYNVDENGTRLPFIYTGSEMNISYGVEASGKGKNVGFLVFVDGISQPYKTDSDQVYRTMHVMNLEENDKTYTFSIIFDPVTGKKGETLSLMIVSVYAPDFMPDMVNTSSYGIYHDALEGTYQITFEADTSGLENNNLPEYKQLQSVRYSTEPVTQEYLDSLSVFIGLDGEVTLESLNKLVFTQLLFDGKGGILNNMKVNTDGTFHLTFKIVGYPGARYRHTFYLNHQALGEGIITSFETTLEKGNISVIDADIELSQLDNLNTFYVVTTLCNVDELWEDGLFLSKTNSVLLYK